VHGGEFRARARGSNAWPGAGLREHGGLCMAGRRRTAADDGGKEGSAEKNACGEPIGSQGRVRIFTQKDAQYVNG